MDRDPDRPEEGRTRDSGSPVSRESAEPGPGPAADDGAPGTRAAAAQRGARGAARPGTRAAGDQGSLELTMSGEGPQNTPAPLQPPAPGRLHPTDRAALAEELHEAATQAVRDQVQALLGPVVTQLKAACAQIPEHFEEIQKHTEGIAAIMDETADGWHASGEEIQKEFRALRQEAREEEQGKKDSLARVNQIVDDSAAELRTAARRIGWRTWLMATSVAAVLLLVVTLLRPGWTMSSEQRAALRVGETVIRAYDAADAGRQAEIRRVLRWRSPPPPTALAPARRR